MEVGMWIRIGMEVGMYIRVGIGIGMRMGVNGDGYGDDDGGNPKPES